MAQPRGRVRKAAASGRPLRDANFMSKRERKAVRKGMVRAYLSNRIAEAREGAADRAEFYRNLRYMKIRRKTIAKEMRTLAEMVMAVQQPLRRIEDREPDADLRIVDEALALTRSAAAATDSAAVEFDMFARRRIYYTEAVA